MRGDRQVGSPFRLASGRKLNIPAWPCSLVGLLFWFVTGLLATCHFVTSAAEGADSQPGIYNPIHGYDSRPVNDRFTRFLAAWESGEKPGIDTSGDLPFLRSLLKELEVPETSQMLVFTATSLQKGLISARNPRALYFNDDTYVGFVPRGRIEVISQDPTVGSVFFIFDRLQPGRRPTVRRSSDCMNCHAPRHLENIPALVVESVVPGLTGGGEKAFRREQSGHGVTLADRFGGWHLTGTGEAMPKHWANLLILRKNGETRELPNPPGERFELSRYPQPTSDLLAQLLHEHQVGFVNRFLQAGYRWRELPEEKQTDEAALAELSGPLLRYLLFTDEVPLVSGMLGESPLAADFAAVAKRDAAGHSLRDLDGKTRLLQHRCSYMVYSPTFAGLPDPLRKRLLLDLAEALQGGAAAAHLPAEERDAIRAVLRETLPEFATIAASGPVEE